MLGNKRIMGDNIQYEIFSKKIALAFNQGKNLFSVLGRRNQEVMVKLSIRF